MQTRNIEHYFIANVLSFTNVYAHLLIVNLAAQKYNIPSKVISHQSQDVILERPLIRLNLEFLSLTIEKFFGEPKQILKDLESVRRNRNYIMDNLFDDIFKNATPYIANLKSISLRKIDIHIPLHSFGMYMPKLEEILVPKNTLTFLTSSKEKNSLQVCTFNKN